MPTAVLVGTLDTKGREYEFVRRILIDAGLDVILIDVGVLGAPTIEPDISADSVSAAAGVNLAELRFAREGSDTRRFALDTMLVGAAVVVAQLVADGRCDGIMGLGGSGGSALISGVMRGLPFGLPKVLVSTMASGDVSAYVGSSDLCILHSVTDIAGLNRISRPILGNAAGALIGMISASEAREDVEERPTVGVTMLGVTTPGALHVVERLDAAGYDCIVFHAVGSGGRALEQLIGEGIIGGVVDYTPKELTDEEFGGVFAAGNQRLRTASRLGLPQVVVPGGIEILNFGALDTVPPHLRESNRPLVQHNADVTAVRLNREELLTMAEVLAERLLQSTGPTVLAIPRDGFDSYTTTGGPFANPDDDDAFIAHLLGLVADRVEVLQLATNINAPEFADLVAEAFLRVAPIAKASPQ